MKSTVKRNLLIGFGISLLLLIVSSVASYTSIRALLESARLVDHTQLVLIRLEEVISYLKDAETRQRGYLLTSDEAILEPYRGAADSARISIQRVKELTTDNNAQQMSVRDLQLAVNGRL